MQKADQNTIWIKNTAQMNDKELQDVQRIVSAECDRLLRNIASLDVAA